MLPQLVPPAAPRAPPGTVGPAAWLRDLASDGDVESNPGPSWSPSALRLAQERVASRPPLPAGRPVEQRTQRRARGN
eukprot:11210754-Lingulodinium_polyedra.AAC.1